MASVVYSIYKLNTSGDNLFVQDSVVADDIVALKSYLSSLYPMIDFDKFDNVEMGDQCAFVLTNDCLKNLSLNVSYVPWDNVIVGTDSITYNKPDDCITKTYSIGASEEFSVALTEFEQLEESTLLEFTKNGDNRWYSNDKCYFFNSLDNWTKDDFVNFNNCKDGISITVLYCSSNCYPVSRAIACKTGITEEGPYEISRKDLGYGYSNNVFSDDEKNQLTHPSEVSQEVFSSQYNDYMVLNDNGKVNVDCLDTAGNETTSSQGFDSNGIPTASRELVYLFIPRHTKVQGYNADFKYEKTQVDGQYCIYSYAEKAECTLKLEDGQYIASFIYPSEKKYQVTKTTTFYENEKYSGDGDSSINSAYNFNIKSTETLNFNSFVSSKFQYEIELSLHGHYNVYFTSSTATLSTILVTKKKNGSIVPDGMEIFDDYSEGNVFTYLRNVFTGEKEILYFQGVFVEFGKKFCEYNVEKHEKTGVYCYFGNTYNFFIKQEPTLRTESVDFSNEDDTVTMEEALSSLDLE